MDDAKDSCDEAEAVLPAVQPILSLLVDEVKVNCLHDVAGVSGAGEIVDAVVAELGQHEQHAQVAKHA